VKEFLKTVKPETGRSRAFVRDYENLKKLDHDTDEYKVAESEILFKYDIPYEQLYAFDNWWRKADESVKAEYKEPRKINVGFDKIELLMAKSPRSLDEAVDRTVVAILRNKGDLSRLYKQSPVEMHFRLLANSELHKEVLYGEKGSIDVPRGREIARGIEKGPGLDFGDLHSHPSMPPNPSPADILSLMAMTAKSNRIQVGAIIGAHVTGKGKGEWDKSQQDVMVLALRPPKTEKEKETFVEIAETLRGIGERGKITSTGFKPGDVNRDRAEYSKAVKMIKESDIFRVRYGRLAEGAPLNKEWKKSP